MVMALGTAGDEYSYFNDKMLKNWAGPSHWRVKQITKGMFIENVVDFHGF